MPAADYGSRPFREQREYFRQKVRLPTAAWTDLWEGMHARAFVVAGAMRDELLVDLQEAVAAYGIEGGGGLAAFRKDFDAIVERHGWQYTGGRNWRTRVIFDTNLRTSYMAGRYAQMKEVAALRPYWRYRHNDAVEHPRPEHLAWDGLILRHDDPWWSTHYPPNGWGCRCFVETLSARDLLRLGKAAPDMAPAIQWENKRVGVRGPSPRTVRVPAGIDPGWAYNVGEAAWGRPLAEDVMAQWRAAGADAWETLTPGDWRSEGRPEQLPLDATTALPGPALDTQAAVATAIEIAIGGPQHVYRVSGIPFLIDAIAVAEHLPPDRAPYIPFLVEAISEPSEVWLTFERHRGTRKVEIRTRAIKGIDLGRGRYLLVVSQARKGYLEAWTVFPVGNRRYINGQRRGQLLFAR